MNKIPQAYAQKLANLHNLVMELQDDFESLKNSCFSNDFTEEEQEMVKGFDIEELGNELEAIGYELDDLESVTSKLDCEYNNYD